MGATAGLSDSTFQMFSGMQAKQTPPPRGPQECWEEQGGRSSDLKISGRVHIEKEGAWKVPQHL